MCDFNRLHGPHNGTLRDVAACDSAHGPVLADNPLEFVEQHGIEIAILAVRAIVEEIADITSMAPRRSLNRRIIRQQRLRIRDQTLQAEQQPVRGQVPKISNRAILHGIVPPDGTRRRRRFWRVGAHNSVVGADQGLRAPSWGLMCRILCRFLALLARLAMRSGRSKDLEIIVLGHRLGVPHRRNNRPQLADEDRALLGAVAATLPRPPRAGWLVTLETLLRWHRRRSQRVRRTLDRHPATRTS